MLGRPSDCVKSIRICRKRAAFGRDRNITLGSQAIPAELKEPGATSIFAPAASHSNQAKCGKPKPCYMDLTASFRRRCAVRRFPGRSLQLGARAASTRSQVDTHPLPSAGPRSMTHKQPIEEAVHSLVGRCGILFSRPHRGLARRQAIRLLETQCDLKDAAPSS